MIDPTTPRLEQKMDDMQERMHGIANDVAKIMFTMEVDRAAKADYQKDLDSMGTKVRTLEYTSAKLDGGLNVLRISLTLLAGILIGICSWVGASIIQNAQDTTILKEKVQRIEITLDKGARP